MVNMISQVSFYVHFYSILALFFIYFTQYSFYTAACHTASFSFLEYLSSNEIDIHWKYCYPLNMERNSMITFSLLQNQCFTGFYHIERGGILLATVKDVAKKAGVSIATVSRVIRNEEIVTPKTREIVLSAIKELNYQPNALARQLRQQETNTVIVIVPDIGNTFFHEILLGIESEAEKYGYQVLIVDMHNKPDIESHYLHALQQRQVDGVISLSANVAKSLMEQVATSSPVVVACQYLDNSNIPNVTIDNIGAARTMVEYLIKLGHTRIAHLTSHPTALLYRDRFNGYISALANHNIPIDLELVKYGESTIASGYEMMSSLLELSNPVTAVFAAGDVMAIGALKALKNAGLNVPGDCSVAGFDDIEISSIFEPALTTISQPKLLMGKTSFKKLLKLMKGEPLAEQQELLNYKLIIRESCGKVKPSKKK